MGVIAAALVMLVVTVSVQAQDFVNALGGLDPVAVQAGKELMGKAQLSVNHKGFHYRFATTANRTAFQAAPERYALQMDGRCARMGPTSGRARPEKYWVYEQRTYVFASDTCREAFKKNPDAYLNPPHTRPLISKRAGAAGQKLLRNILQAHGGKVRLGGLKGYRRTAAWKLRESDKVYDRKVERTVVFPDRFREDSARNAWTSSTVVANDQGYNLSTGETKANILTAAGVREFQRSHMHDLLFVLRMSEDPRMAVASLEPEGEHARLLLHFEGETVTLHTDRSHRVLALVGRARGPDHAFGAVRRNYSEYKMSDGILVPHRETVTFEGKPERSMGMSWRHVTCNPEVSPDFFKIP